MHWHINVPLGLCITVIIVNWLWVAVQILSSLSWRAENQNSFCFFFPFCHLSHKSLSPHQKSIDCICQVSYKDSRRSHFAFIYSQFRKEVKAQFIISFFQTLCHGCPPSHLSVVVIFGSVDLWIQEMSRMTFCFKQWSTTVTKLPRNQVKLVPV